MGSFSAHFLSFRPRASGNGTGSIVSQQQQQQQQQRNGLLATWLQRRPFKSFGYTQ
jgi:hypothetical protein